MRSALVFFFVVKIFAVVHGLPDLCVFKDYEGKAALCGRHDVEHTFDIIPPIAQNITYIDLLEQPLIQLPYNAFRNLSSQSSISRIRLQHCQISHVDAGALLYLHNLSNIDLSHNDIKEIDSKLFSDTKRIKFVYMEYNKIEILPQGLFQNLLQLELVYLQHNHIRQVEWFLFQNTPSLRIIYLNNNQIEVMNMSFKDKFENLTTLSLYGNPWKCNCELGPLYEFLVAFNRFNIHELVCKKPSTLRGRKWSDISRDEFVCLSEDVISTQDSVMTSIESMTSTEQDDNISVAHYNRMSYQQFDSGMPQLPLIPNWIIYTILALVLVCVIVVIIGVVFVVRHTLTKSHRRRHVQLPSIIKRGSDLRTRVSMPVVENGEVSENSDSGLNTDDENVAEELPSIHRYEIREATIN